MNKEKILDIVSDVENKSNKDLVLCLELLENEFNKTKELIINLTRHLDTVEEYYIKISNEIENRKKI